MNNIYKNYIHVISRCAYLGLAALWWIVNKYQFILSEWDSQRINVPRFLYLGLPVFVLALYCLRPTSKTWSLVITIFTLGYALHVYKSFQFAISHIGVKTDLVSTATQMAEYLLVFALCVTVLYMSGPYIRKKYGMARKISQHN